MTISTKHKFVSSKSDSADASLVQPSNWNDEHDITLAAGKVLGRDTSGAGLVQELPIAVDSSGNVGIGTSSPSGDLHIQGAVGNQARLYITDGDTTGVANSLIITKSGTGSYVYDRQAGSSLLFGTADTERMRITSAGNVGIGTTSPSYLLDTYSSSTSDLVVSRTRSAAAASGTSITYHNVEKGNGYGAAYGGYLEQGVGSGAIIATVNGGTIVERMRIDTAGNVGIGTTSPSLPLQVEGNIRGGSPTVSGNYNFSLQSGSSTATYLSRYSSGLAELRQYGGAFQVVSHDAYPLILSTSNVERMRIDSAGNVGIGISSPAVPLHISSASPAIRLTDTDDNSDAQIGAAAGGRLVLDADINNEVASSAILFRVDGGSEKMRITSAGYVGIGTSNPLSTLDVVDTAPIFGSSRGTNVDKHWRPRLPTYAGTNTGTDWFSPFFITSANGINRIQIGGGTSTAYAATEIRVLTAANSTTTTGTERMRIDSAGNVGIGTSLPGEKLHVDSGGAEYAIQWNSTGSNNWALASASNRAYIVNKSTSNKVLTLLNDGKVGIGTDLPSGMLDISSTGAVTQIIKSSSTSLYDGAYLSLRASGVSTNYGETSIQHTIANASDTTDTYFRIQQRTTSGAYVGNIYEYSYKNQFHSWLTSGQPRMRIDSAGNVGIGTSSPVEALDVEGEIIQGANNFIASNVYYSSGWKYRANGYGGVVKLADAGSGSIIFWNAANNNSGAGVAAPISERMRINGAGQVLIGTSTTTGLSGFYVYDATNTYALRAYSVSSYGSFLQTNSNGGHAAVFGFAYQGSYGVRAYSGGLDGMYSRTASASYAALYAQNHDQSISTRLAYLGNWGVHTNGDGYFGGNVGIGTGSPSAKFTTNGVIRTEQTSGRYIDINHDSSNGSIVNNYGSFLFYAVGANDIVWHTNNIERMRINSTGDLKFNSGYGSAATAYGCRAWVNFNGTGTVAIKASGNVSSITDLGTGYYAVNFSTALVDTNYSVAGFGVCYSSANLTGASQVAFTGPNNGTYVPSSKATTTFRLSVGNPSTGAAVDSADISVSVFR